MAGLKFSASQIDKFNDRIENCLNNDQCRRILEDFLNNVDKRMNMKNTLKLWNKANENIDFDDIYDFIDNVDGFNENPLLSLAEPHQKLSYVKSECCRILNTVHKRFVDYLVAYHKM